MRIALDVSPLDQPAATGVERTCLQLLAALQELPARHDYHLLAPRRPRLLPEIDDPRFRFVPLCEQRAPFAWRERAAVRYCRAEGIDLWHSHVQAIPLRMPIPKVATAHEYSWLHTERVGDEGGVRQRRRVARMMAWRATCIVCVSACTEEDLHAIAPRSLGKTQVVHHGVARRFVAARPDRARVEACLGLEPDAEYVLVVGRGLRRKGWPELLRCFAALRAAGRRERLALVGPPNEVLELALQQARSLGLGEVVCAPGHVEDEALVALYAGARAVLVPSRSEGFGMPVLEAMAAGTPVVYQPAAALPEIAGDAGLQVDFDRPAEAAATLAALLDDEEDRQRWIARGRHRVRSFPENGPARALLEIWSGCEAVPGSRKGERGRAVRTTGPHTGPAMGDDT